MERATAQPLGHDQDGPTLVGLVGRGIGPSRTPHMHEAEAARLGRQLTYSLMDVDDMDPRPAIGELVRRAEQAGFSGLNVTHPYKIEVIETLDELSGNAAAVGAVNTVVFRNGRRFGHNTDLWGFVRSFQIFMRGAALDRVLLIGAGGAGAAVAHALADCGLRALVVCDLDLARAEALAAKLAHTRPGLKVAAAETVPDGDDLSGVVNASPLGMAKSPGCPFPSDRLRPDMWVGDIIYFPLETELLRTARAAGCRTMSGAGMAVFQAVRAFELFTGLRPDFEHMRAAFDSRGEA